VCDQGLGIALTYEGFGAGVLVAQKLVLAVGLAMAERAGLK